VKEALYDCWSVICFFWDMNFYIVRMRYVFLMEGKTLCYHVDNGSLNGQIFVSSQPVSGDRKPTHYRVDKIKEGALHIFPVDYDNEKLIVRKETVEVLYWQHRDDLVLS